MPIYKNNVRPHVTFKLKHNPIQYACCQPIIYSRGIMPVGLINIHSLNSLAFKFLTIYIHTHIYISYNFYFSIFSVRTTLLCLSYFISYMTIRINVCLIYILWAKHLFSFYIFKNTSKYLYCSIWDTHVFIFPLFLHW